MNKPTTQLQKNVPSLLIAHSDLLKAELIALLSNKLSFEVSDIITDGLDIFEILHRKKPEYLLIDTDLPNCGSYGFLKKLEHHPIATKVIVYSNTDNPDYLKAFLSSPAIGFIQKGCGISDFTNCLQKIFEGKRIIFSHVTNLHSKTSSKSIGKPEDAWYDLKKLTEREMDVWELLVEGKAEKEIAAILFISTSTVRTHKNKISEKFDIKGKYKLSKLALSF